MAKSNWDIWREYVFYCDQAIRREGTRRSKARDSWASFTVDQQEAIITALRTTRRFAAELGRRDTNFRQHDVNELEDDIEWLERGKAEYELFLHIQFQIPSYPVNSTALTRRRRREWRNHLDVARTFLEQARRIEESRRHMVAATDGDDAELLDAKRFKKSTKVLPAIPDEELHEPGWVGRRVELGSGGQGTAFLWVCSDSDHRVVDQRVVKESIIDGRSLLYADEWHPNLYDVPERIPMEVVAMQAAERNGSDKVVQLTNWSFDLARRRLRLYMEFCNRGDLKMIASHYSSKHAIQNGAIRLQDVHDIPPFIPEPFIWFLLECLINAAVAMEDVLFDPRAEDELLTIVHRDIKPANIFLAEASGDLDTTEWPWYPIPKLGDFGCAIATSERDAFNPLAYTLIGTDGYFSPEQLQWYGKDDYDPPDEEVKLSSATNVWQIAKVVMETMNHYRDPMMGYPDLSKNPDEGDDEQQGVAAQPSFDATCRVPAFKDPAFFYSAELRELVLRCLQYRPKDRPSLQEIQADILKHTTRPDPEDQSDTDTSDDGESAHPDLACGMRLGLVEDEQETWRYRLAIPEAKWYIGKMIPRQMRS